MLTEKRCKELMVQAGMPNSTSLMLALYQLANETAQEEIKRCITQCCVVKDVYLKSDMPANECALLLAAVDDCIHEIGW